MEAVGGLALVILFVGGIVLAVLLFLAPIKLYAIDKKLGQILEELRASRISRGGA